MFDVGEPVTQISIDRYRLFEGFDYDTNDDLDTKILSIVHNDHSLEGKVWYRRPWGPDNIRFRIRRSPLYIPSILEILGFPLHHDQHVSKIGYIYDDYGPKISECSL